MCAAQSDQPKEFRRSKKTSKYEAYFGMNGCTQRARGRWQRAWKCALLDRLRPFQLFDPLLAKTQDAAENLFVVRADPRRRARGIGLR